ncbi:pyridoxal phosphate-dependent aminotransferase family protein [bacterium]|nr:pyridoxal phosphate-dependent aminotransferase family protein [bacterium]
MDLFDKCYNYTRVEEVKAMGIYPYFRTIESAADSEVTIDGRQLIMLGSNNYMGLTQHPKVLEAAINATKKYGSGCTGSRFLNGNLKIHEELEEKLAVFLDKEAALIFSTGFQTNQGVITTLLNKHDIIYADHQDHASIVDGCRLSLGRYLKFKHNDMQDLEKLLNNTRDLNCGKLIIADGIFSMEGDIIKLPELVALAKKHGARIIIDDAHAVGVIGKGGRGTASHFGLENDVDLTIGTFSKSFGSLGGFVVGEAKVLNYVKHHSRAFIFAASPTPAAVASVIAALEILKAEPERLDMLWKNIRKMKKGFDEMGYNTGKSESAVIPLLIGEDLKTFRFWRALYDHGIFVNCAISPAVDPGQGLIRTSYMATHKEDVLDRVLEIFSRVGKEFGII